MRLRKPRWVTASAVAFLVPSLLVGFATVALAAASPSPSGSPGASPSAGASPGSAVAGDAQKGQTVYGTGGCSSCHGASLGGGVGPTLAPIKNLGDTKDPLDPQYLI